MSPWARLFLVVAIVLVSSPARAERDLLVPFGESGRLVLDRVSGLRGGPGGATYAGPVGASWTSRSSGELRQAGVDAEHAESTTLWLAPSFDVFVTDQLSIGGLVEVTYTFGSARVGEREVSLPGTTSVRALPRLGFFIPLSERFGVWPRLGVGYGYAEAVAFDGTGEAARASWRAVRVGAELGLVFRVDETFFFRAGPDLEVSLGGEVAREQGGQRVAARASSIDVAAAISFGVSLDP